MSGLGSYSTLSRANVSVAWIGMALIMSLFVIIATTFDLPVQAIYIFTAGLTLREMVGLASWAFQR